MNPIRPIHPITLRPPDVNVCQFKKYWLIEVSIPHTTIKNVPNITFSPLRIYVPADISAYNLIVTYYGL
jgi:hypothetical protein